MQNYRIDDYITTEDLPIGFELTGMDDNPLHSHSFFEIFYVIGGRGEQILKRKNADKQSIKIQVGDVFLLTPNDEHMFKRNESKELLHRDVVIRKEFFKEVCDYLSPTLYEKILNAKISLKTIISQDKIMQFERDIRLITQTPPSKNEHKKLLIRSFIVSLLHPFISSDIEEYFNNFPTWFNNFLAIFHKVEYMTAGLSKIMSRVNYDSKYLCHVFKNYMGVTMTEYLNDIRLNYSLSLLQNTSDTVSKIANSVGFSSVSHFNVIFKKKFGITPKDLRKKQISVN